MISSVKGDLFSTTHRYIAHGCNARGVMGYGIALQIRDKYPEAYKAYRESFESWNRQGWPMPLGSSSRALCDDKMIYNLVTQKNFGKDGKKYVSYDAIDLAFKGLRRCLPYDSTLAIPMIGAGLGGGDWRVLYNIIRSASEGHYNVVVYEV